MLRNGLSLFSLQASVMNYAGSIAVCVLASAIFLMYSREPSVYQTPILRESYDYIIGKLNKEYKGFGFPKVVEGVLVVVFV